MIEYNTDSFSGLIDQICVEQQDNDDLEDEMEFMKFQYEKGILDYKSFLEGFRQILDLIIEVDYQISTITFSKLDRTHCLDILPCYRLISSGVIDKYRDILLEIDQKYIQIQDVLFQKGVIYYAIKMSNYQKYDIFDSKMLKVDVFDKKVNLILDQ